MPPMQQSCLIQKRNRRLDKAFIVVVSLLASATVNIAAAAKEETQEQVEKRNQEFDQNERELKKNLYGVDKPWEVLVPYGADILRYNYRRTYPQTYDKVEAARLKREREQKEKDEQKTQRLLLKDKSGQHTTDPVESREQEFDEMRRLGAIAEAAQLLKVYCDENDLEHTELKYEELRKLGWTDFGAQMEYAFYLKTKRMYTQARTVAKNAMKFCTDEETGKLYSKLFQFDWTPRDLSLPDDEFRSRRPPGKRQFRQNVGRWKS